MTPAHDLHGIVAIPVTPFRDGDIDVDTYRSLLDRVLDAGITTITPHGNTGEFYALTPQERHELLRVTAEHCRGRATVLAGVGHDTSTAIADISRAADAGAAYVMVHQPVHPHVSRAGWVDYHAALADASPTTGVVLYVRDTWVTGTMIRSLADRCRNVVGVKYAVPDPVQFARVRTAAPELAWIAGLAEPYALSYLAHGAVGFTSGLVTVNPWLSVDLLTALRAGDHPTARALTERLLPFEALRAADRSADNVSVVKEALAQLGLADRAVRAPASGVAPAVAREVAAVLQDWARDYPVRPARVGAGA